MSNFTKSIVYSGMVLVAGLIAVFTLYNNMTQTDVAGYASMEPAAGEMAQGIEGEATDSATLVNDTVAEEAPAVTTEETPAEEPAATEETTEEAPTATEETTTEEAPATEEATEEKAAE